MSPHMTAITRVMPAPFLRGIGVGGMLIPLTAIAAVLALAVPALSINTGPARANSLGGDGAPAQTLHVLEASGVPSAVVFLIQVLTHGGPAAATRAEAIAARTLGVYAVLSPAAPSFRQGSTALPSLVPTGEGNTPAGTAVIGRLRSDLAGVPGGVEPARPTRRWSARSPAPDASSRAPQ